MIETGGRRAALWPSVREEIWMALNLVFLAETNLALPFAPLVYVSDSSDFAYSVMWTRASRREIVADAQYRERWRFAKMEVPSEVSHLAGSVVSSLNGAALIGGPVDTEEGFAEGRLSPQGTFGIGPHTTFGAACLQTAPVREHKPRLGRSQPQPARLMAEVELLRAIPEISATWESRRRWQTYREGPWRWPAEHINIKEGRASLMALDWHVRSAQQHHCRIFQLSDNLVSVLAFDKGRSKSWALNALCRRACATQLAADVVWRLRHVRSDGNVADEGSRLEKYRSPLQDLGERLFLGPQPIELPAAKVPTGRVRPPRARRVTLRLTAHRPLRPSFARHLRSRPHLTARVSGGSRSSDDLDRGRPTSEESGQSTPPTPREAHSPGHACLQDPAVTEPFQTDDVAAPPPEDMVGFEDSLPGGTHPVRRKIARRDSPRAEENMPGGTHPVRRKIAQRDSPRVEENSGRSLSPIRRDAPRVPSQRDGSRAQSRQALRSRLPLLCVARRRERPLEFCGARLTGHSVPWTGRRRSA